MLARLGLNIFSTKSADTEVGLPEIEDLDPCACGFDRPLKDEREKLAGSKEPFTTHLLLSSPLPAHEWPDHAEESSPQLSAFAKELKSRKKELPGVILTFYTTAGTEENTPDDGTSDLLWFPARKRISGITAENVKLVLDSIAAGSTSILEGKLPVSDLEGSYIFVCAHKQRDSRCGYCGAVLTQQLLAELALHPPAAPVTVRKVSHVGGHVYAGNVLVYGMRHCDWYGLVRKEDIPQLIELATDVSDGGAGGWIPRLWRARLGLGAEEVANMINAVKSQR
eukprot:NODE_2880_length_1098_cov_21.104862_g2641_i0.p1 GENE.NODE_2880_length_1098_cov_21.104862_g2641_i0~~NODE_2880_length_1098_cov_21.104862_g2641_i0.p1  ORF type:complete len:281 (+),score=60.48 NODE_2880_length_1098_cov_21.104862_g2641_i0:85-927(+)